MHQQCGKEDVEDPFKGLEKPPGGTNSVILQEGSFPSQTSTRCGPASCKVRRR